MRVRFDTRLVEEIVRMEAKNDLSFRETCIRQMEPVYEYPEEERAGAFAEAYARLFALLPLGNQLQTFFNDWAPLKNDVLEVLLFKALNLQEESCELSRDRNKVGLRVQVERLANPERLYPFLRHELMHIGDMLSPRFAYREESITGTLMEQRLVLQRYRVLWDTYIDGRLERLTQTDERIREDRQREFELAFAPLSRQERATAFYWLWESQEVTHVELWRIACDPSYLNQVKMLTVTPLASVPGTLCPLCRFPTYNWAKPTKDMVTLIRQDFPSWSADEGMCQRCYECYSLLATEEKKEIKI